MSPEEWALVTRVTQAPLTIKDHMPAELVEDAFRFAQSIRRLREALEAEGGRMLEDAKAVTAVVSRRNKLQAIAKYFPGTKAAAEASDLLGQ